MSSSHPFSLAALSLSLSHFAAALPPLTLEPLSPSCSSYPSYNPTTQIAGPWPLLSASTGTPIENATASIVSFTNDGKDRYGFVRPPLNYHNLTFYVPPHHRIENNTENLH